MHVQRFATAKVSGPYEHRPGGIRLTEMLAGEEFALDNFALWVVDTADEYFTPRHRHNFDQVRVMLEGEYGWSPTDVHRPGTIGYFTEGTYYAQRGIGESRMLLLQVAGASGQGYMSLAQLDRGIKELKEAGGTFKDGVYTKVDETGQKHNKDGHEAVWEHTFGKPVKYQAPRFQMPVFVEPDSFVWLDTADPGVKQRRFGVLNERGLEVGEAMLDAGATFVLDGAERPMIAFVMDGEGTAGGEPFGRYDAMHVKRGERGSIVATAATRLVLFGLPVFAADASRLANAA